MEERATELEYLDFFRCEADFGPAHEDVVQIINDEFTKQTGKKIPKCWEEE